MAATVAKIGFGCTAQRGTGSPLTYADIGEVIDPGSLSMSRDTVDATHTASTDRYREFLSGLRDGGEFTFTIALVPSATSYTDLVSDFNSNSAVTYRYVFNDSGPSEWTFSGFVTALETVTPIDDRMTVAVTIKVSGKPVLT